MYIFNRHFCLYMCICMCVVCQ